MLVVKLLFRGHFFINAVDKVVIEHLMQRGKVYPSKKLPPPIPTPSPGSIPFNQVLMKHYLASLSLLGSMKSSGWIRFYWWDHVYTLHSILLDPWTPHKNYSQKVEYLPTKFGYYQISIFLPSFILIYIYIYVCMYVCIFLTC